MGLFVFNQILSVDISDYINAAIFRHLSMFGNLKCNVRMLPVQETNSLSKDIDLEELQSFDFSIELRGKVYNFKMMICKNSKCQSLLTREFANNIIWAMDNTQDYNVVQNSIHQDSYNYVYQITVDEENYSEVIYLNVCNVQDGE